MNHARTKRKLYWVTGSLAALFAVWAIAQFIPRFGAVRGANPFRAPANGRPLMIAHAGGAGLQPENTLQAFVASAALGCDMLEMDVRLTKEGELVTHHDATLERTSNGKGAVLDHTVAELKALDFGCRFRAAGGGSDPRGQPARLATLPELFERFPDLPMTIELKDRGEVGPRAAAALAALIANYHRADKVLVASFDDTTLDAFRRASGRSVGTSAAKGQTRRFVLLHLLRLDRLWPGGVVAAQVPSNPREAAGFKLAQRGFIEAAHARNMAVHYWTVNDPEEMRRLIRLGADGLITDFPDRLKAVLAEH
jgi:glycerophosphoryl diester phosphodiesterase